MERFLMREAAIGASIRFFRSRRIALRLTLVEIVGGMLGITSAEASALVDDLVLGGYVVQAGVGDSRTVQAGPNLDTKLLRAIGFDVPPR